MSLSAKEIKRTMRELRMVESGEIFETHLVRDVLIRADRTHRMLHGCTEAVCNAHARAVRAFVLGWPGAKDAPWVLRE